MNPELMRIIYEGKMVALAFVVSILPAAVAVDRWECKGYPLSLAVSGDGLMSAVIDKDAIVLLTIKEGKFGLLEKISHENPMRCSFLPKSNNIIVADATGVTFYIQNGKRWDQSRVEIEALFPKRMIVTGKSAIVASLGGDIWEIDLASHKASKAIAVKGLIDSVALSKSENLLAVGLRNGTVSIINLITWKETVSFQAHPKDTSCIVFLTDNTVATGGGDKKIHTWLLTKPDAPQATVPLSSEVLSVCVVNDSLCVGALDGAITIVRIKQLRSIATFKPYTSDCHTIQTVNSHSVVAIGKDRSLSLFLILIPKAAVESK